MKPDLSHFDLAMLSAEYQVIGDKQWIPDPEVLLWISQFAYTERSFMLAANQFVAKHLFDAAENASFKTTIIFKVSDWTSEKNILVKSKKAEAYCATLSTLVGRFAATLDQRRYKTKVGCELPIVKYEVDLTISWNIT